MIPDSVRNMSNPYRIGHRLNSSDFIGRETEKNNLYTMLDDYSRTLQLTSTLVTGEKSIGKSSLLSAYKQILEDNNFFIYETELSTDDNIELNEYDFFKDFFDFLLKNNTFKNCKIINEEQVEIWNSLTSGCYDHDSKYSDRKISFATQYSNYVKGVKVPLSFNSLELDLKNIVDDITINMGMEINGIAIIIDEFQELCKSTIILDFLRQVTEKFFNITVVSAGLPKFTSDKNFEKFCRISRIVDLKPLDKNEIINLICKPLEKTRGYRRYEVLKWFDPHSIDEIVSRSGGNPLHVSVLCQKMFDEFKKDKTRSLICLDRSVMDSVMSYYSAISKKSSIIKSSLETFSKEQLMLLSRLYKYEGFSVKAAIHLNLAFDAITPHNEEREKSSLLEAFSGLFDFKLFDFSPSVSSVDELHGKSISELSQIKYKFIGDPIDKLYAAYYYEDLTTEKLTSSGGLSFEQVLSYKYAERIKNIGLSNLDDSIPVSFSTNGANLLSILDQDGDDRITKRNVKEDLDKLVDLGGTADDSEYVKEISDVYDLSLPSFIAEKLELLGYYYVISDLNIKGKRKFVYNLFPVKNFDGKIPEIRTVLNSPQNILEYLDEYMVRINDIYIYWIPQRPFLIIFKSEFDEEYDHLEQMARERDFERAVLSAERIVGLGVKLDGNQVLTKVDSVNNFSFCLINIDSLDRARKHLVMCSNYLLAKVNLSYINFIEGDLDTPKSDLSKIVRKAQGKNHIFSFINLAINHDLLSHDRKIVENVLVYNISCWNLALISAYRNDGRSVINSYLKKVEIKSKNDKFVHERVCSWIFYIENKFDEAMGVATENLLMVDKDHYIYNDIQEDINIFKQNCL